MACGSWKKQGKEGQDGVVKLKLCGQRGETNSNATTGNELVPSRWSLTFLEPSVGEKTK